MFLFIFVLCAKNIFLFVRPIFYRSIDGSYRSATALLVLVVLEFVNFRLGRTSDRSDLLDED